MYFYSTIKTANHFHETKVNSVKMGGIQELF
jgi:hypothetical protein